MNELSRYTRVNRRGFLKIVGFTAGGAVLTPLLPAAKQAASTAVGRRSRLYQGTNDGKLFCSSDGCDWALLTDFGPHLAVGEVNLAGDGWLQAELAAGEVSFVLKSRDGKTWYTQEYVAPGQV